jgi:hypothetical protein
MGLTGLMPLLFIGYVGTSYASQRKKDKVDE